MMWLQTLLCKRDIYSRLKELGLGKREVRRIMLGITHKRYYRAMGSCHHCRGKIVGKYGYANVRPPGSATLISVRIRVHEGLFCVNCGVELFDPDRADVGNPLSDNDLEFFRYSSFVIYEFKIKNDDRSRNFFDLLREEADIPDTHRLKELVGEREWLRGRLAEVEGEIAAIKGAEDILAELEEMERPQLMAANE